MIIMEITSSMSLIVDATEDDLIERETLLRDEYVEACEKAKRRIPSVADEALWWPRAYNKGYE